MTDRKNIKPSNKESEIIKISLDGIVRLEYYPNRGYVIVIQVDKNKLFYMEMKVANDLIEDYNEIIKLRG